MRSKAETQRIGELTAERASLVVKLRDKDEELKGKAKLLEVRVPVSFRGEDAGVDGAGAQC